MGFLYTNGLPFDVELSGVCENGSGLASITSGGCRVESDSGDIDARLEQRFKVVEEAFQAEWNKDAAPQG